MLKFNIQASTNRIEDTIQLSHLANPIRRSDLNSTADKNTEWHLSHGDTHNIEMKFLQIQHFVLVSSLLTIVAK